MFIMSLLFIACKSNIGGNTPYQFTKISTGYNFTCGLANKNNKSSVWCWGDGRMGQLGNAQIGMGYTESAPVQVVTTNLLHNEATTNISVADYGNTACLLTNLGNVYCWGNGNMGQLGNGKDGNNYFESIPVLVNNKNLSYNEKFNNINVTGAYICALSNLGNIYCWGYNYYGNLGNDTTLNSSIPVKVSSVIKFKQLFGNNSISCAVSESNQAYCWGLNDLGQTGSNINEVKVLHPSKVLIPSNSFIEQMSINSDFGCAILKNNQTYCWGKNKKGQLGNNNPSEYEPIPVAVNQDLMNKGSYFKSIHTSALYSCAVSNDNHEYCWGYGPEGQLANDCDKNDQSCIIEIAQPMQIQNNNKHVLSISYLNTLTSCSVFDDNQTYCWGAGDLNGTNIDKNVLLPHKLDTSNIISPNNLRFFTHLTSNDVCAIDDHGYSYCWGMNEYGNLGTGNYSSTNIPTGLNFSYN